MEHTTALETLAAEWLQYLADVRRLAPQSIAGYRSDLGLFFAFLGESYPAVTSPEAVTRDLVVAWVKALRRMAPATVRRKLACLSAWFRWMREVKEITKAEPTRGVPKPRAARQVPRLPAPGDIPKLLRACRWPWQHALITLLATTGMRRAEAADIRLADVDLEEGTVLVHGKGGRDREIPLDPLAVEAIRRYLPYRRPRVETEALLVTHRGGPVAPHTVYRTVRDLAAKAQVSEGLTTHWLRHDFATGYVQAGGDVRDLQALLGHETVETTMVYVHPSRKRQRETMEKMARRLG